MPEINTCQKPWALEKKNLITVVEFRVELAENSPATRATFSPKVSSSMVFSTSIRGIVNRRQKTQLLRSTDEANEVKISQSKRRDKQEKKIGRQPKGSPKAERSKGKVG